MLRGGGAKIYSEVVSEDMWQNDACMAWQINSDQLNKIYEPTYLEVCKPIRQVYT